MDINLDQLIKAKRKGLQSYALEYFDKVHAVKSKARQTYVDEILKMNVRQIFNEAFRASKEAGGYQGMVSEIQAFKREISQLVLEARLKEAGVL